MREQACITRPRWHFAPQKGWINDPNGLVWFHGKYHLYFQCNPHSNQWDKMHWGHAVSQDLIHWEECQPVLFPEEIYENDQRGGCFSGSVIEHEGRLYAFYTAVVRDAESGLIRSQQCLAWSDDGYQFKKYQKNPIIPESPSGSSDFRDPKVIFHKDRWQMLVGGTSGSASDMTSHGRIYLYHSKDLTHWEYDGILYEGEDGEGTMFECPDLFELDGKWIITASPMNRTDFLPTVYMVGALSFKNCLFCKEGSGTLDFGPHYYASQTYHDRYGHLLSIAWLGGWEWMPWIEDHGPSETEGYRGLMSCPRLLSIRKDGRLEMKPIRPIEMTGDLCVRKIPMNGSLEIASANTGKQSLYLHGQISRKKSVRSISFTFRDDGGHMISLTLDFLFGNIIRDYHRADPWSRSGVKIYQAEIEGKEEIPFDIIYDGNALEICLFEGDYHVTSMLYPTKSNLRISLESKGGGCSLSWEEAREPGREVQKSG